MTSYAVAQIIGLYLPLTETFIYEYLINMRRFRPEVFTEKIENLDLFPLESVNLVRKSGILERAVDKIAQPLIGYKILNDSKYLKLFRKKKIGLVHVHFGWYAPSMVTIAERLNIPLITTFYGADMSVLPTQEYYKKAYKKLFAIGDLFLVEGSNMKKDLEKLGCPKEKIRIQHIGIDLEKFAIKTRNGANGNQTIRILMCNSFREKKGTLVGIKAFARSLKHFKNIELHIVGDGILRDQIEGLIKELKIGDKVKLFGYQKHEFYRKELAEAHIFMAPSFTARDGDSEGGAPTVLLEAQASGIPVLSTFHADIPEVTINKKSSFLVPEKDPESLSDKLNLLLGRPEIWPEMGKIGRAHIEAHYNIRKEVEKLENIYNEFYVKH